VSVGDTGAAGGLDGAMMSSGKASIDVATGEGSDTGVDI
jgi:hypothetical protein